MAELERRFYAFVIDRMLGWLPAVGAGVGAWLLFDDGWLAVGLGAGVLGVVWLVLAVLVGVWGSTPGKSLTGLRVVHQGTGTPIGVGRALLRSAILALASVPTFAMGLATLAWTAVADRGRQRRGWHDHVAQSVVVDVRPVDAASEDVDDTPRHVVNLTALRLVPAPPVEAPTPLRRASPEPPVRRTAPVPTSPPVTTPPPDDGRTVVRSHPRLQTGPRWRVTFDNGETFVVEGLALVGRRPEPRPGEQVHHLVPLASGDMSVSKTHAQFGPAADGALVVMDRGSTNGSMVVRQGVTRPLAPGKPATVMEGDIVSFGDRQMSVSREA